MGLKIGVLATQHIAVGVVEESHIIGQTRIFPEGGNKSDYLADMHAEEIAGQILRQITMTRQGKALEAVGVGFPGIIRDGVIEESPNLPQMKGQNLEATLTALLAQEGSNARVSIINDADAMAAGIAAERGHLDKIVRVWFLGSGIGFGRYPQNPGFIGEGGHTVVTLDLKENLCRCGGFGHLEGIMGQRAMRLRFLDLEPEEVFEEAKSGDERCVAFVQMWHRALAAATATSIHLEGPGKFYISGPDARFVQADVLQIYLHEMVKMSPLQGSAVEVISTSDEIAIVGAAISAAQAASNK